MTDSTLFPFPGFLDLPDRLRLHERLELERLPPYIDIHDRLPLLKQRVSILIVSDGLTFGESADFGLGMAIAALRESFSTAVYLHVETATRAGTFAHAAAPAAGMPNYTGFRFNSQQGGSLAINRFDQIWCFGIAPGNGAFNDGEVTSNTLYATDPELAELARWMNERQGGVFATGDHAHLGACLAHRIPRVGTMRKWLIADNPPTFTGPDRFDTNRPASPGLTSIPDSNQEDATPQPVTWLPEFSRRQGLLRHSAPHPIFCGGSLGPIDVFPDHQHEGQIVEDSNIVVSGRFRFTASNGTVLYEGDDYPQTGSSRTRPKIIARAHTLAQSTPGIASPYLFGKGPTPVRDFGLVGVYDGLPEGVGRVVVDSTWHHWLNINLKGFAAATDSTPFRKIKRYFQNVALWLANRTGQRFILQNAIWNALYTYEASQELDFRSPVALGASLKPILWKLLPPCTVTELLIDFVPTKWPIEFDWRRPFEPVCLTCPPLELFEDHILGEIAMAMQTLREEVERQRVKTWPSAVKPPSEKLLSRALVVGSAKGLQSAVADYEASIARGRKAVTLMTKTLAAVETKPAR